MSLLNPKKISLWWSLPGQYDLMIYFYLRGRQSLRCNFLLEEVIYFLFICLCMFLCFFLSINAISLFTAFQTLVLRYEPFLETNILSYQSQASLMSTTLFGEYGAAFSRQYLPLFLIGGFLTMILATVLNTIGLPLGLIVIYGMKKYKSYFDLTEKNLINRGYTKSEAAKYSIGWFVIIVGIIAIFSN